MPLRENYTIVLLPCGYTVSRKILFKCMCEREKLPYLHESALNLLRRSTSLVRSCCAASLRVEAHSLYSTMSLTTTTHTPTTMYSSPSTTTPPPPLLPLPFTSAMRLEMLLVLALGSKEPLVTFMAEAAELRLVFEEVLEALVEAKALEVKEAWALVVVDRVKEALLFEAEVVVVVLLTVDARGPLEVLDVLSPNPPPPPPLLSPSSSAAGGDTRVSGRKNNTH